MAQVADGQFDVPSISKPDGPITRRWVSYWENNGARVHIGGTKGCPRFDVRFDRGKGGNPLTNFIRSSRKSGEKRILHRYLTASRADRLEVLAGLLDGDGSTNGGPRFDIFTKYPGLAQDIIFLARSLGFHAWSKSVVKKIESTGFSGVYQAVYVSGDMTQIPTIQKFGGSWKSIKAPLCHGIRVESIGDGEYFGFELDGNNLFMLGDFTVTHNSFVTAYCALLDYLAAPILTSTTLTTTKFDSLRTRIWGDLMNAIESSAIRESILAVFKPTTTSNELKLGIRDRERIDGDRFQIQGVATDSADATASKIRGQHTDRRRIIGDECEDMGEAIYTAIANARVAPDFKAVLDTNPALKMSLFGSKWACPRDGWGSVTVSDLKWETVQPNGICLHFDGLQSPNIKAGRTVHPYLLDQRYVDDIRITEGEDSLKWWMFVRGFPAPDGIVGLVWPSSTIEKATPGIVFDYEPEPFAALDPAFDHDACVLILGYLGWLRNGRPCAVAKQSIKINVEVGAGRLDKEVQIANSVIDQCAKWGVKPENFIQDATGNGQGVFALLKVKWSPKVQTIYYGGEATDRPLRLNDTKKASEQVRYFVAELWFRASYLAREGLLCGLTNLDRKTVDDIAGRRYLVKQNAGAALQVIESKTEYKLRLGRSPDYGDTFCQIGELMVRKGMLAGIAKTGTAAGWDHLRKLAVKAASRYEEGKTYGET